MSDGKIKILTFGAATQDVFLRGKALHARRDVRSREFVEQFPLGAKLDIDDVVFDIGGGATNAAVTFARQGLATGFVGKIGHDPAGAEVLRVLRREGIETHQVAYDTRLSTGYSTLLLADSGERTILSYRGASHNLQASEFAIRNLEADWFYISSLAGNLDLLGKILKHANRHGIQVALNPGGGELAKAKKLKALLPLVTVLMANRQELGALFGGEQPRDILRAAAAACQYTVLTDGPAGSYVSDGQRLYRAGQYAKVRVVDRTGAGDAFCSGFVAALATGQSIAQALSLGSANSTSVVQVIGAKPGILKTDRIKPMRVTTEDLT